MSQRYGIRSKRALIDGALRPAAIVIEDGRIADVLGYGAMGGASMRVHEVTDVLLPGLVDTHVHVNEPGRTEWEGFETATRAAASGGVSTLIDMPLNCIPVTTTQAALETKRRAVEGLLSVDVGFWGGVVPGNAGELTSMAARGMLGAKCFLCHSGIDDFPACSERDLLAAMPVLRDAGAPLLVHAELDSAAGPASAGDVRAYATYLASRPPSMEDAAIALMIELCRQTGCAVHVVHLSSASAIPLIRAAKDEGLPITAETCPHYLCLSSENISPGATEFKCAPPIRDEANREQLWQGLAEGVIDMVTSDHSPCTPHLKRPEEGDFCAAWGGIASLSLGLSSVWAEGFARSVPLARIVTEMSERPARLAGLSGIKGSIARGADADFVAFDPDARWRVEASELRFRHHVSPYVGREVRGRVKKTWLRGEVVFDIASELDARAGRAILGRNGRGA